MDSTHCIFLMDDVRSFASQPFEKFKLNLYSAFDSTSNKKIFLKINWINSYLDVCLIVDNIPHFYILLYRVYLCDDMKYLWLIQRKKEKQKKKTGQKEYWTNKLLNVKRKRKWKRSKFSFILIDLNQCECVLKKKKKRRRKLRIIFS